METLFPFMLQSYNKIIVKSKETNKKEICKTIFVFDGKNYHASMILFPLLSPKVNFLWFIEKWVAEVLPPPCSPYTKAFLKNVFTFEVKRQGV